MALMMEGEEKQKIERYKGKEKIRKMRNGGKAEGLISYSGG